MPQKSAKSKAKTKTSPRKNSKECSHGISPSVGIIFTLAIALIVTITISVCAFQGLKKVDSDISNSKLEVFDHLAESYISEMDFTVDDKPTLRSMTGYGVSDEDGVFYATFDYIPYEVLDDHQISYGDTGHGIIYFWKDKERGTYSHAFSYHEDAGYHPAGVYVKVESSELLK